MAALFVSELIIPYFSKLFEEYDVYENDVFSFPDSFAVNNCEQCNCIVINNYITIPSEVHVNESTGEIIISSLPSGLTTPGEPINSFSYRTDFEVACTSGVTKFNATKSVNINWHPVPQFGDIGIIQINEDAKVETVIAFLQPLYRFPYKITYDLPRNTPFRISENTLKLGSSLNFSIISSYALNITATGYDDRGSSVIIPVQINVVNVIDPARFTEDEVEGRCDGSEVEIAFDLREEFVSELEFTLPVGDLFCLTELRIGPSSVFVAVNLSAGCASRDFSTVLTMKGRNSHTRDTAIVRFIGCSLPGIVDTFALRSNQKTCLKVLQGKVFD